MKVVIVSPHWFPYAGGIAVSSSQFAEKLRDDGHDVTIVVPKQRKVDTKGFKVVTVPLLWNMLGRNPVVIGLYSRLKKVARDADVIVLYSYMYEMNARVALYRKLGLLKTPVVLMYRGGLEAELGKQVSWVLKAGKWLYDVTLGRLLFRAADRVISNAGPTLEIMRKKYGVDKKKLAYVKNAVEVEQFKPDYKEHKRVTFVGRLVDNKGVKLFPDILQVMPKDWEFCIVGDGPLEGYVKGLQREFPQVVMKGSVPYEQVMDVLSKSDVLVLPTFAEGSPRAVLEAAASGVPSVAFDVGDVINVVPKDTGFVIERFNVKRFCEKTRYLIEHADKRKRFGKNARAFAEKELDWGIVYKKMLKEVKAVVRNHRV